MKPWQFDALARRHGKLCFWCQTKLNKTTATKDHVIPVALGGGREDNVVLCCFQCNQERGIITDSFGNLFLPGASGRSGPPERLPALLDRFEALVRKRLMGEAFRLCLHEILSVRAGKLTWEPMREAVV